MDDMNADETGAALILSGWIRDLLHGWTEEHPEPGLWQWTGPDEDWPQLVIVDGRHREVRVLPPGGGRVGPSVIGQCRRITVNVTLPPMVDSTDMRMALQALAAIEALPQHDLTADAKR
jgi:hypothetical protein